MYLIMQNEENLRKRPGQLPRSSMEISQTNLYDQRGVCERRYGQNFPSVLDRCYGNYSFSDGARCRKDHNKVRETMNLPNQYIS
jgi:hypothetical protein